MFSLRILPDSALLRTHSGGPLEHSAPSPRHRPVITFSQGTVPSWDPITLMQHESCSPKPRGLSSARHLICLPFTITGTLNSFSNDTGFGL